MDWILMVKALVLGVVEGLTEFLPVSSTGHLIVAGSLLNFTDAQAKTFDVVIQFGAILAICWEYRAKIGSVVGGLGSRPDARRFAINVIIATIPAIVLGLLLEKKIKSVLFSPVPVSVALIVGGIVILLGGGAPAGSRAPPRVHSVDDLSYADALKVGIAQCLALIPGTSRSGATIIGGMLFGLERRAAAILVLSRYSDHLRRDALRNGQVLAHAHRERPRALRHRARIGVRERLHLRALAAPLRRLARFHGIRVVSHRLRAADSDRRL